MIRNDNLDKLKGLAIILVVLGHAVSSVYPVYEHRLLFKISTSFHMPLFMFVSGYLTYGKVESNYGSFVKQRAFGLLVPYLAWFPFEYVYRYAIGINTKDFISTFQAALIFPREGLWFLYVLFLNLLVLVLCKKISNYIGDVSYILVYFILRAGMKVVDPNNQLFYFGVDLVMWLYIYVAMGYLTAKYREILVRFKPVLLVASFLYVFFMVLWNSELLNALRGIPGINFARDFSISLTGIAGSYYVLDKFKIFAFLRHVGRETLAIYAIHGFFLHFSIFDGNTRVFCLTLVSLILSLFVARILKKSSFLSFVLLGKTGSRCRSTTQNVHRPL